MYLKFVEMINLQHLCLDCIIASTKESIFDLLPLPQSILIKLKYRFRSKIEWINKHEKILNGAETYSSKLEWSSDVMVDHSETIYKFFQLSFDHRTKFELASIYCMPIEVQAFWNSLSIDQQSHYLAERSVRCDPIVIFWTGICANQAWLADSYLVRAFYWAAEHNFVEALTYFWIIIQRERADAVVFRAIRAFELGAYYGHMQILTFLWSVTDDDQRRQMVQGALRCSQGSLRALENACKSGRLDILQFLYNEATFELRHLMLRSGDCFAFRTAADENQIEIVEFFLQKASKVKLRGLLLVSDECSSFRKATLTGNMKILKIFWSYADEEDRKCLLTAPFYLRRDLRQAVSQGYSNVAKFLWDHSSSDLQGILAANFFAPSLSPESFSSMKDFGSIRLIDEDL